MRRGLSWPVALIVAVAALASPAAAYVPLTLEFADGAPQLARWPAAAFPVPVTVSRGLSTDLPGSSELPALLAALDTWSTTPDSAVDLVFAGEAPVAAGVIDGINAIEFSNDPSLQASAAAMQTFLLTDARGTILEADILVNDRTFGFSIDGGNVGLDLETALLREIGHFLGLDSSPLGTLERDSLGPTVAESSAVMFPVPRGPGELGRQLRQDDVAAVAALYPANRNRGSIRGVVTQRGEPVFGAHVIAFEARDDVLVGAVSLPDGSYTLDGLPPGRYLLRVQPLASPAGPDTLDGVFGDPAFTVNTTFRPAFFLEGAVEVRAGERVDGIDVSVQ